MKVLFVDDEPLLLTGLERLIFTLDVDGLDVRFAGSGPEALELLAREPMDAVISDMRMPGMSGAELLLEVKRRAPLTLRFVLSGQADDESTVRAHAAAHDFLAKPLRKNELSELLTRATRISQAISRARPTSCEAITGLFGQAPSAFKDARQLAVCPDTSAQVLDAFGAVHPAQLAAATRVIDEVVGGLSTEDASRERWPAGAREISSVVAALALFDGAATSLAPAIDSVLDVSALKQRALLAAMRAAARAPVEQRTLAVCAGALSTIGLMLMAHVDADGTRARVRASGENAHTLARLERDALGYESADLSACLLTAWGVDSALIEGVLSQAPIGEPTDGEQIDARAKSAVVV